MNTLGYVNTTRTGYDDFSSLRSRLTTEMPQIGSSIGDSEDPITAAAVTTDGNKKHERTTVTENETLRNHNQSTFSSMPNENSGLTGYDDFSSLRSRLAAQIRSSVDHYEDPVTTAAITTDDNFAQEGMTVPQNDAHDADC